MNLCGDLIGYLAVVVRGCPGGGKPNLHGSTWGASSAGARMPPRCFSEFRHSKYKQQCGGVTL